jgi:D-3-phosphoglycerate dehydrogenase
MVKVLVADTIHEDGVKMMVDAGLDLDLKTTITAEVLSKVLGNYDAVVVRSRTKLTREILEESGKLKVIARAGVGLDNVDVAYAMEKGIEVYNSPEAPSNAVAELVLGFMLDMARNISRGDHGLKQGKWLKSDLGGFELQGKTLGIIGFGRIGYLLGKKAKALGMTVIAYDVIMDKLKNLADEVGVIGVKLDRLFAESDFVSIHVPLIPQTKHMISVAQLNKMKRGSYIINAARGGVVDEAALKTALDSGQLAGAALDVFEEEPNPDPGLVTRLNVLCTPHIGAETEEAQRGNSTIVAEKLIKFFK